MIDLNSLALYKNKISSYVDQNVLGISTKSNILSLFNFRNYTGNGLTIPSSIKINEGVASNFSKNTFITTPTKLTSLNDDFEIQVKFNYFQKHKQQTNRYAEALLGANTLEDRLYLYIIQALNLPYQIIRFDFTINSNDDYAFNNNFHINYNFDENLGDYYIKIIKENNNYTMKLYDENFNELSSVTNQTDKQFKAANLTLGAEVTSTGDIYARNLTIDLNETFIKQNGQIVSSWNI